MTMMITTELHLKSNAPLPVIMTNFHKKNFHFKQYFDNQTIIFKVSQFFSLNFAIKATVIMMILHIVENIKCELMHDYFSQFSIHVTVTTSLFLFNTKLSTTYVSEEPFEMK